MEEDEGRECHQDIRRKKQKYKESVTSVTWKNKSSSSSPVDKSWRGGEKKEAFNSKIFSNRNEAFAAFMMSTMSQADTCQSLIG